MAAGLVRRDGRVRVLAPVYVAPERRRVPAKGPTDRTPYEVLGALIGCDSVELDEAADAIVLARRGADPVTVPLDELERLADLGWVEVRGDMKEAHVTEKGEFWFGKYRKLNENK